MSGAERILIATHPFGATGREPLRLLEEAGYELVFNPYGRRLKQADIPEMLDGIAAIIAGTEPYSQKVLEKNKVKVISRVGIGLDSVPLNYCKKVGIQVTYTPDAPSRGVAELTLAQILNLARHILPSDHSVRAGAWNRLMGKLVSEMTIGVLGVGRIGKLVIQLLDPLGPRILACDNKPDKTFSAGRKLEWVDRNTLFTKSDLVTLHIPGNRENQHLVNREVLSRMKTGSYLINTSRGTVIDEEALYDALVQHHLGGAALDVFDSEPYEGPLSQLDQVVLTAHIAASASQTRLEMELQATRDCIKVLQGEKPDFDALTKDNLDNSTD